MSDMLDIPEGYALLQDDFCSNFDHAINEEVVEKLKTENVYAYYPAWNFHGSVWYDHGKRMFMCKVKCYRCHVTTIEAETAKELVEFVCDEFGWD